jgi:hypothetical protein
MWNVKSTAWRIAFPVIGDPASDITCDRQSISHARNRKFLKAERQRSDEATSKRLYLFVAVAILPMVLFAGVAGAQQYPIIDQIANRVVQKYQNSSCEQLWQKRGEPKSPREQEAVQALRNDPQARAAFIDRVAAPIANKMFECGLLP